MPEPHVTVELDQPGLHGRRVRLDAETQPLGCPPHQRPIA
jgi:hypothetical protein